MYRYFISLFFVVTLFTGSVLAEEFKVGKPFVQLGHSDDVNAVAITPDGKYIVSGSKDKNIKLWDIKTGKEIRTFTGHTHSIYSITVTSNSKYILSGSGDGTIKLWSIKTGKIIRTFKGNSSPINSVSTNGDYVISGNDHWMLDLWSLKTGKRIKTFKGHRGWIRSVCITSDGKNIVSGSGDKTIKLWDVKTGKIIRTFEGHTDEVSSVAISTGNKYIVSGSTDGTIKIWDVKTGKNIKTFTGYRGITSVAFTSDNKYIVSADDNKSIKVWEISTSKNIKTFKIKTDNIFYTIYSVVVSNDNKYIVSGTSDDIILWDIRTGEKMKTFTSEVEASNPMVSDRDNKYIFARNINNSLKLLDARTGETIEKFEGHSKVVTSVAISPDSKYTLSGGWDEIIKLFDISTGENIKTYKGSNNPITTVAFSMDGDYVLSGGIDNLIRLWDMKTGEIKRTFIGHNGTIESLLATPNGKYILSGSEDNTIKLWDINTGENIKTFKGHKYIVRAMAVTTDSKYLISGAGDNLLKLWDIKTGKNIKTFKGHSDYISSVAITPDNKYILSGSADRTLKLWDIKTGKNIKTYHTHLWMIESIIITKDAKHAYLGSSEGTVKYWDIKTGKELVTFVSFTDGEWLSITPEGYFNASKNGAKHLNILTGPMQVSSIDQYYETFYRPDIVASVMSGKVDKYAKSQIQLSDVKPAPQVVIIDTKTSVKKEELKVTLKITPSSGGIGQIRLYLDGVLIKTDGDRGLKKKGSKKSVLKTFSIKVPKGKHTLKAIVYNQANTMASRENTLAVVSTYNPIVKPNIYAVVIGINEYKNPTIALKYAVADAELFAKTIKKRTKGLYGDVKVELLTTKKQTSKENITKTLKKMENMSPNDLFIFFVASHGMIEDAKYHMITSNVGSLSTRGIKREAISQESLRDMIANIPTTKKVIILDTCNSGALGKTLEVALLTRGLTETTAMKVLSRAVGSTIISASSSSQEALEGYKGHGLLTYVLTDGLNGKADSDRDGYIKTREIANFVEDTVPEIAEREFKRAQYPFVSPLGQGFPLVKVK